MAEGAFHPLPRPLTADGEPRLVGVELEFGDLPAARAAKVLCAALGGTVARTEPDRFVVAVPGLGDFAVELDTALKPDGGELERIGRELARPVIPVEVVCPPVESFRLPRIQELVRALADAGASGTDSGPLRAFGMHLNVACVSLDIDGVLPVLRAFALLEDWLREAAPIDISRRLTPFVDPYPRAFIDALAERPLPYGMGALADLYLAHNATRNRALDLMPVLAMTNPEKITAALGPDNSVSARPTFHYRLPDSGIGIPGWTIAAEWNRWVLVEQVAADAALLETLAADWRAYRESWTTRRQDWRRQVAGRLSDAGLAEEEAE